MEVKEKNQKSAEKDKSKYEAERMKLKA